MPLIEAIRARGITSLQAIARELVRRRVLTARGGKWNAARVRVLLERASKVNASPNSPPARDCHRHKREEPGAGMRRARFRGEASAEGWDQTRLYERSVTRHHNANKLMFNFREFTA